MSSDTSKSTMERDLKNKVAIVTGGADGIGFAICEKYLEGGVKAVIILNIDDKKGSKAVKNQKKE